MKTSDRLRDLAQYEKDRLATATSERLAATKAALGRYRGDLRENDGAFAFLRLERGKARPSEAFARYSTFVMLFIWAFPMAQLVSWAYDDDIAFWLGSPWPISIFLLPVFWATLYWLQAKREVPSMWILIILVLIPCIIFDAIGGDYMNKANLYANQLLANDCTALFDTKYRLNHAYNEARGFLAKCIADGDANQPFFTIDDCPGYKTKMAEDGLTSEWEYLKRVEARHFCVGFCEPDSVSTGMWYTSVQARDACDQAIGQKLIFVKQQSVKMLSYSVIISALFIVWALLAFPTMHQTIGLS